MTDNIITKRQFSAESSDAKEVVRQVWLDRLRREQSSFHALASQDTGFNRYVTLARERDEEPFRRLVLDVFWDLVVQGLVAPGTAEGNPQCGFFHLTDYGRRVLAEPDYQPHDPMAYIRQLGQTISTPDATVLAYLKESLECFSRSVMVASAMMLGIAAERVFLLVCESLVDNLRDPKEQAEFAKLLDQISMKKKMLWVTNKFQEIQDRKPRLAGLPDSIGVMAIGIYDMIRCQRNDVGHPQESPPSVTRDAAYGYLRVFPSYFATAEKVREFLANNKV